MSLPVRESTHRRGTPMFGADYDVFTQWRKLVCYTQRPGVTKAVKRKYNRRARAREKRGLRQYRQNPEEP